MPTSVHDLYGDYWGQIDPEFELAIGASLKPRSETMLLDRFAEFGIGREDTVLDVGAARGRWSIALAQRFGCRVIGVEAVPRLVAEGHQQVTQARLTDRVTLLAGTIESLPIRSGTIDAIWCRDMLNHVDLPAGLVECFRVLQPGRSMLVYQTFATDALEPKEAARLYRAIAIVAENMDPIYFESTAAKAGFEIVERDAVDSEWREHWLEAGETDLLEDLLRVARLRRREAVLVERFGRARFEAAYAGSLWGIYQLLGKLCPTVYILRKPAE